jgi:hypothetical protein
MIMKCLRVLILLTVMGVLFPVAVRAQQPPPPDTASLVFEREVFAYPTFERRNPFVRVLSGSEGGPRYEELQLIGIIFSSTPDLSVALFGPRGGTPGGGMGSGFAVPFEPGWVINLETFEFLKSNGHSWSWKLKNSA